MTTAEHLAAQATSSPEAQLPQTGSLENEAARVERRAGPGVDRAIGERVLQRPSRAARAFGGSEPAFALAERCGSACQLKPGQPNVRRTFVAERSFVRAFSGAEPLRGKRANPRRRSTLMKLAARRIFPADFTLRRGRAFDLLSM